MIHFASDNIEFWVFSLKADVLFTPVIMVIMNVMRLSARNPLDRCEEH